MDHLLSLENEKKKYDEIAHNHFLELTAEARNLINVVESKDINSSVESLSKKFFKQNQLSKMCSKEIVSTTNVLAQQKCNLKQDINILHERMANLKKELAETNKEKAELRAQKPQTIQIEKTLNSYKKHLHIAIKVENVDGNKYNLDVCFKDYEHFHFKIHMDMEYKKILSVDLGNMNADSQQEMIQFLERNRDATPFLIKLKKVLQDIPLK